MLNKGVYIFSINKKLCLNMDAAVIDTGTGTGMFRYNTTGRVYVKRHVAEGNVVLAICDEELLGASLRRGDGLEFVVSTGFYGGELVGVEEALKYIDEADIVNMVGNEIVGRAIEEGYVVSEAVIEIDGVKHAQIVRIMYG